ncbi:MAG: endonuclease V [Myxococcota bacterium]
MTRIAITDVAYFDGAAVAACVVADRWGAQFPVETHTALRTPVADYVPGAFWQRELPCLQVVLDGLAADVVVVDGYVWLDDLGRKGLGAHLHDVLGGVPVVGIAKTSFDGSAHARSVVRGVSVKPLYVTAVGIDLDAAAAAVASMHGAHRLPTLCALVDRIARTGRTV